MHKLETSLTVYPPYLFLGTVHRVLVIFVLEGKCPDDESVPQTCGRDLVAELVFLALLALADAEDVWLMERVYLVAVNQLAVHELQAQFEIPAKLVV